MAEVSLFLDANFFSVSPHFGYLFIINFFWDGKIHKTKDSFRKMALFGWIILTKTILSSPLVNLNGISKFELFVIFLFPDFLTEIALPLTQTVIVI